LPLVARYCKEKYPDFDICFNWVGKIDKSYIAEFTYESELLNINPNLIFIDETDNPHQYINDFDLYFLSSREDPFPLSTIEAAYLSKTIICYRDVSGIQNTLLRSNQCYIKPFDIKDTVEKILYFYHNRELLQTIGASNKTNSLEYDTEIIGPKIYDIISKYI
jgi:glycosyltransferase involved in cell wall biosynthesis